MPKTEMIDKAIKRMDRAIERLDLEYTHELKRDAPDWVKVGKLKKAFVRAVFARRQALESQSS